MKKLLLATAAAVALPAAAFAQTAPAAATDTISTVILTAVIALVPSLFLSGWAWFKAHAAASAAKWDDEAVAFVEKIAQGVVDKKTASPTGTDH